MSWLYMGLEWILRVSCFDVFNEQWLYKKHMLYRQMIIPEIFLHKRVLQPADLTFLISCQQRYHHSFIASILCNTDGCSMDLENNTNCCDRVMSLCPLPLILKMSILYNLANILSFACNLPEGASSIVNSRNREQPFISLHCLSLDYCGIITTD